MPAAEKKKRAGVAAAKKAEKPPAAKAPGRGAASAKGASDRDGNGGAARQQDGRGKYVYCVIEASETLRFGPLGIGVEPADVHTVNYKDIAAVVSDTPIEVHDPTRENVLAHERVNETVMRKHTVIPMSFGTVFKTRDDIVELLRSAYDAFHDVLVKMQDKLEFGVKVLWDREVMIRLIEQQDDDVRRLKNEISGQKG